MQQLKELLKDWDDWDGCAAKLAYVFGIIDSPDDFGGEKWVFWSNNTTGNFLHDTLEKLVELGILLKRDDPDAEDTQYKWNDNYKLDQYS